MASARRILIPVSVATGLSLLGDTALYTVLPTNTQIAGITLATVGIILSVNRFIRLFLNGPIGLLVDRWPRKAIFVPATMIGALSTLLYAVAVGFWPLLLGRLLWGVAWAGIWVSGNAIVLDATTSRDRGRWVGIYQIAFFLGAASGSIFGGIMTDLVGYRLSMAISGLLSFAGALVALLFLPETGQTQKPASNHEPTSVEISQTKPDMPQLISSTAWYSVNRLVMAGIFVGTFSLLVAASIGDSVEIWDVSLGVSSVTGIGLGMTTLLSMFAAPAAGSISDRLNTRWGVGAVGIAIGIIGMILVSQGLPFVIILGLPLISIGSGSSQSLATALVGDLSPAAIHGRRLGILFTAGDLGSAIGPPLAYSLMPLLGISGLYRFCAGLLVIILIVAIIWTVTLTRRSRTAATIS